MGDTFDALREADRARRQQVRDAIRLADLLCELENVTDGPYMEGSARHGRQSAAAIRRVVDQHVDRPLAPPDALATLIEWAEDELNLLAPLTAAEMTLLEMELGLS